MSKNEAHRLNLEIITQAIQAEIPKLRREFGITYLGVFGSYVRGEQRGTSDLDLLVEFIESPTLPDFVRLERRLSDLVGVKVDLVMKSALKPNIGERILKEVVGI